MNDSSTNPASNSASNAASDSATHSAESLQLTHPVVKALGRVAMALPGGGERRTGQQTMALAVADAIHDEHHLIVQAGTGTGKSLGYLVPALLSGKHVVVATATKALQDQLYTKDLPFLDQHLGVPFTYALLKGRSNYYCVQRAMELRAQLGGGSQLRLDGSSAAAPAEVLDEITKLATWAANSASGDRAELSFEPSPVAWGAVSVSAAECPGAAKCPAGENCFAEKAKIKASTADVVVVNMHLYGQHIRSGGYVLPEHQVVILDEAHELEDIVSDSLGVEISSGRFIQLAARFRAVVSDIDQKADVAAIGPLLDAALLPYVGKPLQPGPSVDPEIRRVLNAGASRIRQAMEIARQAVPKDAPGDLPVKLARAMQAATALAEEIDEALELGVVRKTLTGPGGVSTSDQPEPEASDPTPEGRLAWVEAGGGFRGSVLRISPVDIGPILSSMLWSNVTAILTSATIPQKLAARLWLPSGKTREVNVGSPFDFQKQGMLYCARHLPDPREASYEASMIEELRALIGLAGGRTMALFTSWKAMKAAAEACSDLGVTILTQGEHPKPVLVRRFTEEETSCLFATMGFWQGIDVPGRTCSMVVIDKLPFSRPDDPLLVARREKLGAAAFALIDLPRASTLLAQGVGRLIRSSADRGVVAVLDPRLSKARYANDLVRALPPLKRTRHREEVGTFLKSFLG
jgi:ATP-dependent DNA helicase DinG